MYLSAKPIPALVRFFDLRFLLYGVLALALGWPSLAAAQEQADLGGIENIIVTIGKRPESQQDFAGSVKGFNEEMLQETNVSNVADLVALMPSVQTKGQPSEEITIRGISQGRDTLSPVARHVNGIYKYDQFSYLGVFYDLEGVDVSLGPAGTVYGRNATAGAINTKWNKPHAEYEFGGDITLGNHDQRQVRGFANIPLLGEGDERLMARIVVQREVRDGWINNAFATRKDDPDGADDWILRASLRSKVTEDISVDLRGFYTERDNVQNTGILIEPVGSYSVSFLGPGGPIFDPLNGLQGAINDPTWQALAFGFGGFTADPAGVMDFFEFGGGPIGPLVTDRSVYNGTNVTADSAETRRINSSARDLADPSWKIYGFDGELEWNFHEVPLLGDFHINVLGGWERYRQVQVNDTDGTEIPLFDNFQDQQADTWTGEFRLSTDNDGIFSWILGAFYFNRVFDNALILNILGVPGFDIESREENGYGVFANLVVRPTESFEIFGGARFNRDKYETRRTGSPIAGSGLTGLTLDAQEKWREWTGEVGAKFFFGEDNMVYAKWMNGYKPGLIQLDVIAQVSAVTAPQSVVDPEAINAWEIGYKSTWLDKTLQFNIAAYYYEYSDLQITFIRPTGVFFQNAAEATVKGIEADILWQPSEAWTVRVAGSWLDATFDEFCANNELTNFLGTEPACEGRLLPNPVTGAAGSLPGEQDLSGNRLEDAPPWKFTFFVKYNMDLGEYGTVKFITQNAWTADYYLRPFNKAIDTLDSHWDSDFRVVWSDVEGRQTIELFVQNIWKTSNFSRIVALDTPISQGPFGFGLEAPQTYGIRLGYKWGAN